MPKFVFTKNYEEALCRIEDYVFGAAKSVEAVESFLDEHDRALKFIGENPNTPAIHPVTGDQSWNFGDGRYRLFFKCVESNGSLVIYFIHLIDNKEVNLAVYPRNKIPTYDEE